MAAAIGVAPDHLVNVHQIHSPDVVVAEGPWPGPKPRADGLVTRNAGRGPRHRDPPIAGLCCSAIRARGHRRLPFGWRGAFTGVLEATLAGMEDLGADRSRVVAVLGPTIGPTAYEVGPEFVARFVDLRPDDARYFRPSERAGHSLFDLPSYIGHRLSQAAWGASSISRCAPIRTRIASSATGARFHRGEPDYGRLIAAIALDDA